METDIEFKDISDLLSGIKSKDGENNLLDLLSKMYDTKLDLNITAYILTNLKI